MFTKDLPKSERSLRSCYIVDEGDECRRSRNGGVNGRRGEQIPEQELGL